MLMRSFRDNGVDGEDEGEGDNWVPSHQKEGLAEHDNSLQFGQADWEQMRPAGIHHPLVSQILLNVTSISLLYDSAIASHTLISMPSPAVSAILPVFLPLSRRFSIRHPAAGN